METRKSGLQFINYICNKSIHKSNNYCGSISKILGLWALERLLVNSNSTSISILIDFDTNLCKLSTGSWKILRKKAQVPRVSACTKQNEYAMTNKASYEESKIKPSSPFSGKNYY